MDKLILDPALLAKLTTLDHGVELCDPSGRSIGWFQPVVTAETYEGLEPPFSEEELRRAEQEGGGRPLSEILADLERMQ
jgi:hypothetical protein